MKRRLLITAIIALALGLIAVPVLAQTGAGIGIDTPMTTADKAIFYDANGDGIFQPEELLGTYDVYNPQLPFNFHWGTAAGATYYRVSLIQYLPPGKGPGDPSQEIKISHHAANDPNGTRFSMSPSGAPLCLDCVTVIQVVPETMTIVQDDHGANVYQYTQLAGKLVSEPFVFELPPRPQFSNGKGGASCPVCGDTFCSAREANVTGLCWCPDDCSGLR